MTKEKLTTEALLKEANKFASVESSHNESSIYGTTDGKAIGTYFEHKFQNYLLESYDYEVGSSAKGKDFPDLNIDMKVTSVTQPQSSSPFRSARQKVYGLGYSLLVFVYEKTDDAETKTGNLKIHNTIYVDEPRTADYQTTTGIRNIIENNGNIDDLIGFMFERNLPVDDIQARDLAEELLSNPPKIGYLTISNALQWRLQYSRAISMAGEVTGIVKVV